MNLAIVDFSDAVRQLEYAISPYYIPSYGVKHSFSCFNYIKATAQEAALGNVKNIEDIYSKDFEKAGIYCEDVNLDNAPLTSYGKEIIVETAIKLMSKKATELLCMLPHDKVISGAIPTNPFTPLTYKVLLT